MNRQNQPNNTLNAQQHWGAYILIAGYRKRPNDHLFEEKISDLQSTLKKNLTKTRLAQDQF